MTARSFAAGVRAAGLPAGPRETAPVTESDLAGLPEAAQHYLRAMGVVGRPRTWSFRAHYTGRLRLRPGGRWMPMTAWQYNSGPEPARMVRMRLRLAGVVPMTGWDTYVRGRGRMHGRLLGLVTVADGAGPEFDVSELVTWLNDAVMFAPSILLGRATTWTASDSDHAFDIAVTDAGRQVRARVLLDANSRPREFTTTDRWAALPGGLIQAQWTAPVTGWRVVGGRPLPSSADAVWYLSGKPFHYAQINIPANGLDYDVPPGTSGRSETGLRSFG